MPGKALAIMLIALAGIVTVLALVLTSLEGVMIEQWGRAQRGQAEPAAFERSGPALPGNPWV